MLTILAIDAYLRYLETECEAYVNLCFLESWMLNPIKDELLKCIKRRFNESLMQIPCKGRRTRIRQSIINRLLNLPNLNHRKYYDFRPMMEEVSSNFPLNDLEEVRVHGRKCCSVCCTKAFVVEAILFTLMNVEVEELIFSSRFSELIYEGKPVKPFAFFDAASVLVHYAVSLNERGNQISKPSLKKLYIDPQLQKLSSKSKTIKTLCFHPETAKYPKFRYLTSETVSESLMFDLLEVFDNRPRAHFESLTELVLNSESLETSILGSTGADLLSGIGYSCPVLETLDISSVTDLEPCSLLFLIYPKDRILKQLLHRDTFISDDWIFYVMEDGFYQEGDKGCVTVTQCINFFDFVEDLNLLTKSLRQLILPPDDQDFEVKSRSWVLPILLNVFERLDSLGHAYISEALRLCRRLNLGWIIQNKFPILKTASVTPEPANPEKCLKTLVKNDENHWRNRIHEWNTNIQLMDNILNDVFELCPFLEMIEIIDFNLLFIDKMPKIKELRLRTVGWSVVLHSADVLGGEEIKTLVISNNNDNVVNGLDFGLGRLSLICPNLEKLEMNPCFADDLDTGLNLGTTFDRLTYFVFHGNFSIEDLTSIWTLTPMLKEFVVMGEIKDYVFDSYKITELFSQPRNSLIRFEAGITFNSIPVAQLFAEFLSGVQSLSTIQIRVSLPENNNNDDDNDIRNAVSDIIVQMESFKIFCRNSLAQIKWKWIYEGLLGVVFHQAYAVHELVDP